MSMDQVLGELPDGYYYVKCDASGFWRSKHYDDPNNIILRTSVADLVYFGDYRPHLNVLEGKRVRPADECMWARTIPGPCFGSYPRMKELAKLCVMDRPKNIPVFFAGSYENYPDAIRDHRLKAIKYAFDHGIGFGGRAINPNDYMHRMMRTKVALCPWGNGELSYRMYEAWHCGAVPVMPHTSWVNTWFGKLRAGVHYVPYKADSSDLHEVCKDVLETWDSYHGMRLANFRLAKKLVSKEFIEEWKAKVFA